MKTLVTDKSKLFDYEILDKYLAGISLLGWEVKSLKSGTASLKDAFVVVNQQGAKLVRANISKWKTQSASEKVDTERERWLLLNKSEIDKIISKKEGSSGSTVVPLRILLTDKNKIKVELALVRGKKKYDKREKLKELDTKRQIESDLKEMYK